LRQPDEDGAVAVEVRDREEAVRVRGERGLLVGEVGGPVARAAWRKKEDNDGRFPDNATAHPTEIAPLRELLEGDPQLAVTTLEIGKGGLAATRTS